MYDCCQRRDCEGWFVLSLDGALSVSGCYLSIFNLLVQVKKHIRAQEIAREHGLPCIYLGALVSDPERRTESDTLFTYSRIWWCCVTTPSKCECLVEPWYHATTLNDTSGLP